jgi:hypothetical protein
VRPDRWTGLRMAQSGARSATSPPRARARAPGHHHHTRARAGARTHTHRSRLAPSISAHGGCVVPGRTARRGQWREAFPFRTCLALQYLDKKYEHTLTALQSELRLLRIETAKLLKYRAIRSKRVRACVRARWVSMPNAPASACAFVWVCACACACAMRLCLCLRAWRLGSARLGVRCAVRVPHCLSGIRMRS